jgi:hypothetical protein
MKKSSKSMAEHNFIFIIRFSKQKERGVSISYFISGEKRSAQYLADYSSGGQVRNTQDGLNETLKAAARAARRGSLGSLCLSCFVTTDFVF